MIEKNHLSQCQRNELTIDVKKNLASLPLSECLQIAILYQSIQKHDSSDTTTAADVHPASSLDMATCTGRYDL